MENQAFNAGRLRHPGERWLLSLCIVVSFSLFVVLLVLAFFRDPFIAFYESDAIATYVAANPEAAGLSNEEVLPLLPDDELETLQFLDEWLSPPVIIVIPVVLFLTIVFITGKDYGKLRANAVRITAEQFPEVYAMWDGLARDLGLEEVPDLYTINGDGVLNASAWCVPGFRNYSAIYSDVLETCLRNQDWESLKFILAHEAAHIRLSHVKWWYMIFTLSYNFPPLNYPIGLPLGRAKEYSCDKVAHALTQDHDCKGLLMLTAGKHLYDKMDLAAYVEESVEQGGWWSTVYNLTSSHPIFTWRVNAIRKGHNGGIFFRRK